MRVISSVKASPLPVPSVTSQPPGQVIEVYDIYRAGVNPIVIILSPRLDEVRTHQPPLPQKGSYPLYPREPLKEVLRGSSGNSDESTV